MPPLAAALPAIGSFLGSSGFLVPAALGVGSAGLSMIQSQQAQKSAEKAQKANIAEQQRIQAENVAAQQRAAQQWQETAYPSPTAVSAMGTELRGAAGQARLGSYQNLASQLAARGFGPSSGLMAQGATGIEREYLQTLGRTGTELAKFQATPMFAPPSQAYPSPGYQQPLYQAPVSGALEAGLGKAGGVMENAFDYYMIMQLAKNMGILNPTTTNIALTRT